MKNLININPKKITPFIENQNKKYNYYFKIILFFTFILYSTQGYCQCMSIPNATDIYLNTGTLVAGTANSVGAKYRYSNAAPGVDVLVTVLSISVSGASTNLFTLRKVDALATENAINYTANTPVTGFDENFQPYWTGTPANGTSYAWPVGNTTLESSYKFEFSANASGTTVIPIYRNIVLQTIDNDGASAGTASSGYTINEQVEYSPTATSYALNSPTSETQNGNIFTGNTTTQSGIGSSPLYVSYAYYFNIQNFTWTSRHLIHVTNANNTYSNQLRLASLAIRCQYPSPTTNFITNVISGNVFNDINGLSDNTINGLALISPTPLYANLLDVNGNVVATTLVDATTGHYSFDGVNGNTTYSVQLNTIEGVVGIAAPSVIMPNGWTTVGENIGIGVGTDGNPNSNSNNIIMTTGTITNVNFGIEHRPVAIDSTLVSVLNPGGNNFIDISNSFAGTDQNGGIIDSINISSFPLNAESIIINGIIYTSTTFPIGGVTVLTNSSGVPSSPISVNPIDGDISVAVHFTDFDNAGFESLNTGVITLPIHTASISGTVFNDPDGGNVNNSTNLSNSISAGLFAHLLDNSGNILESVTVNSDGIYSFNQLNAGNYTVEIDTLIGTVGNSISSSSISLNWVNTGEYNGTPNTGNDGNINSISNAINLIDGNITNVNFGIEQRPVADSNYASTIANPGDTNSIVVNNYFSGSDASNGSLQSITLTSFPSNIARLIIDTVIYTSATFPISGITILTNTAGVPLSSVRIDPINGITLVVIPYTYTDNAGYTSSNIGAAYMPFSSSLNGSSLPVTLEEFNANWKGSNAILNWTTVSDFNFSSFDIERSIDGENFARIGNVSINTNTTGEKYYTFNDSNAYFLKSNSIFYRINFVDINNKKTQSEIRSLYKNSNSNIELYPNPSTGILFINYIEQIDNIAIYNTCGQLINTINKSKVSNIIDYNWLPNGVYNILLTLSSGNNQNVKFYIIH